MSLSALRSVGDAIDVTREFLMPISIRRWGLLALVVAFMGTAGTPVPANPQFLDPFLWQPPEGPPGTAPENGVDGLPAGAIELPSLAELPPRLFVALAAVLALVLAYVLLGVLMRFVFVEALRSGRVSVLGSIRRHFRGAVGVIGFRAVLWTIAALLVAVGVVAVTDFGPDFLGPSAGAIVAVIATAIAALLWIVDAITLQFVVPVMIHEGRGVIASWRRLWPALVEEWAEYLVFGFVRLAIGVAVGIVAAVALVLVLIAVGIALGTVAAAVVVLSGGLGGLGTGGVVVLAGIALLFLVVALVAFAVVNVPFQVYLWYYALLVLGDTDEGLDLIPDRRAATRRDEIVAEAST